MDARELEGRVAIITGGGRGFGKAFGHALANHGAHVVLSDIDPEAGVAAAREINNADLHSAAYNEPIAASGLAKVRRLFDVNVMGTIICTLAAQPRARAQTSSSTREPRPD